MYDQLKLSNQLCYRLYTASRLITQHYEPFLKRLGVTYPQYLVLLVLWEQDRQTVNHIAHQLLLETNTMTPLLKRMESQNLLTRTRDTVDHRKIIVALTDKGKRLKYTAKDIPSDLAQTIICQSQDPALVSLLSQLVPNLDVLIADLIKSQNVSKKNHN